VDFNREVTEDAGRYFTGPDDVAALVDAAESDPEGMRAAGRRSRELATSYDWDEVAAGYEDLALRLADRRFPARRPSGRRIPTAVGTPPVPRDRSAAQMASGAHAGNGIALPQQVQLPLARPATDEREAVGSAS
jgi:hypothetical protein